MFTTAILKSQKSEKHYRLTAVLGDTENFLQVLEDNRSLLYKSEVTEVRSQKSQKSQKSKVREVTEVTEVSNNEPGNNNEPGSRVCATCLSSYLLKSSE